MATNVHNVLIKVKQIGASKVSKRMLGLSAALAGVGLAATKMTQAAIRSTDAMTNLGNKARVFAKDNSAAAARMATVVQVARTMNMELDGVADVMQRVSMSADQVGLSNQQVTKMVSNLAKATKLSGATQQEATGALRQFGQALAANRLSGQELNSILEQTPMIAQLIANSMGVAVGELRALGKEGRITAEVMVKALGGSIEDLEKKFAKFEFPIADQIVSIRRELTFLTDNLTKATGAGELLKSAFKGIKDFLVQLNHEFDVGSPRAQFWVNMLKGLGVAAGGLAGLLGGALLGNIIKVTRAITAATAATKAFKIASMTTPWGFVIGAASLAAGAYFAFRDSADDAGIGLDRLTQLQKAQAAVTEDNVESMQRWVDSLDEFSSIDDLKKNIGDALAKEELKQPITFDGESFDLEYFRKEGESAGAAFSRAFAEQISGPKFTEKLNLENQLAALYEMKANGTGGSDIDTAIQATTLALAGVNLELRKMSDESRERILEIQENLRGLKGIPTELKGPWADMRSQFDATRPFEALQEDAKQAEKLFNAISKEMADEPEALKDLKAQYDEVLKGILDDMLKAIPASKTLGEAFNEQGDQFKKVKKLAGDLKVEDLPEYLKRTTEATEDLNDATEAQDRINQDAIDTLSKINDIRREGIGDMPELLKLQNEEAKAYDDLTKKALELVLAQDASTAAGQAMIDMILAETAAAQGRIATLYEELEARQAINALAASGNPVFQAEANRQDLGDKTAAIQGMYNNGNGRITEDDANRALEYMHAEAEMENARLERMAAMTEAYHGLVNGTLTWGEASAATTAGIAEGMERVVASTFNIGAQIANITQQTVGGLANEIANLATTGDGNFKQLGRSFVTMITQMIVKLVVMMGIIAAISALPGGPAILQAMGMGAGKGAPKAGGGGGGVAGLGSFGSADSRIGGMFSSSGLTGQASGGPVVGGTPILVGERGPELFVPPQSGSIKNNTTTQGMMGQQAPQVTVVNVDSTENTLDALGSEEGESIIMNVIQRNPEILRSIG